MSKKAKTPDGEKCKRQLPFKLNDEDKARKGELTASLQVQLESAQAAKKADASKHNEKIGRLTKQVSAQLKMISEGIERREVSCTEVKNFDRNMVEFWFEGTILEEREMTTADRQLGLAPAAPAAAKRTKKPWQRFASKGEGEESRDEEIAKVHRLETSKKGASSAVDPV